MSVLTVSQAIQNTELFTAMRESALVYPIILSLHLTCISVFGGLILMTDLRLLGVALKNVPVSDVIKGLRPWKWLGFIIMVSCGIMLAGAKLATYYDNTYFQFKMTFLALVGVHAFVFHRSVYGNTAVAALDRAPTLPRVAKVAAVSSLVIWIGIMSFGRWIAYYERPEDKPKPAVVPIGRPPTESGTQVSSAIESIAGPLADTESGNQVNWSLAKDDTPLLSWIETLPDGSDSLKYSMLHDGKWSEAQTVAAKRPFFHQPAELPEVISLSGGSLMAHWIEAPKAGSEAENIYISASQDGVHWTNPTMANKDRHPVQHGLASMVASGPREASLVWLQALKGEDGPVSLIRTVLDANGAVVKEENLDSDVCACCPTSIVKTQRGLLVAYRDHTPDNIRDIATIRFENGKWSESKIIFPDNWRLDACPVNAASAGAKGENVAIAWYTAASDKPRVEMAFSADSGATFSKPVVVSTGEAYGYASVAMDDGGGGATVSWLERGGGAARLLVRHVAPDGVQGAVTQAAQGDRLSLGYPRLVRAGNDVFIAWGNVKVARLGRG